MVISVHPSALLSYRGDVMKRGIGWERVLEQAENVPTPSELKIDKEIFEG